MSGQRKTVSRGGFTLVELLVVIGIIAVLIGILLPALMRARAQSNAVKCMSNLHQIAVGLVQYATENGGAIIPSYNLPLAPGATTNYTGGPGQPLEGWACILDRDGLVPSPQQDTNTIFYCPDTVDIEGVKDGQTGNDPGKPRGWTDWPLVYTTVGGDSSPKVAVTIPGRGFTKIIRVSYWLNAYNPIGSQPADISAADLHYTASVGLGPDLAHGSYIRQHKMTQIRNASELIAVADGCYMGRQAVTQIGNTNSRIGYRHPGMNKLNGAANVAFADGHVDVVAGNQFPRALSSGEAANVVAQKKTENMAGMSVYANPAAAFP